MATKGTRKRRVFTSDCANPLFVKWVEELKNEAVEKNSKAQYTYSKALSSLRRYPLPLSSGQEAKLLDHIGEKLAKILDKKLSEYRKVNGSEGEGQTHPQEKREKKRKKEGGPSHTDCDGVSPAPKSKRKKSCDQGREYVPVYRSGPYAILVALHTAEQKPSWQGYLTKTELIREAQDYADSSFTVSEAGSYYTAWSSMTGLVGRGLVVRYSHPPRFKLSESGVSLAVRLLEGEASQSCDTTPTRAGQTTPTLTERVKGSKSTTQKESLIQKLPSPQQLNKIETTPVSFLSPAHWEDHPPPHTHSGHRKRLEFWYVSAEGDQVMSKDRAAVSLSEEELSVGFLVKCKRADLEESVFKYIIDKERCADGDNVYAYLGQNGPDYSNPPTVTDTPVTSRNMTPPNTSGATLPSIITLSDSDSDKDLVTIDSSSDDGDLFRPLSERIGLSRKTTKELFSAPPPTHTPSPAPPTSRGTGQPLSPAHRVQDTSPQNKQLAKKSTPIIVNKEKKQVKSESSTTSSVEIVDLTDSTSDATAEPGVAGGRVESEELGAPDFVLRPGEFEIVLCVDSAESTASRKHTSQFRGLLLQELAKNGVQFDVRKLNVGDFLWVGREKVSPVTGQLSLPLSREVVLEYIVERKRMDDLAGSITDGRFKEQKFRLQGCGVSRRVYLVEEYQDMTHLSIPLSSLNQSLANTQVIDQFYVKRTKDIRESIAYLTIMTRQLSQHYADKTLEAHRHEVISEALRAGHPQCVGNTVRCAAFWAFNEASIKNKVLSVYEMLGRQLMQLPGVSADKAAAILKVYPTVASLRAGYSDCANTGEQVKMLSNIKAGKTHRRLGDSVSSLVYSLYCLGKDC